jgi:hypothetical protein
MMYKMTHVHSYVWFMIFRCVPCIKQASPLWQAFNLLEMLYCVTTVLMVMGVKHYLQIDELHLIVVHQLCVFSDHVY